MRRALKRFLAKYGLVPESVIDRWFEQVVIADFARMEAEGICTDCLGDGFFYGPYEGDEFLRMLEGDADLESRTHPCERCDGTGNA